MDPKSGFENILDEIQAHVESGITLRAAVEEIVTLGGRVSFAQGMQALTPIQAALFEEAPGLPVASSKSAAGSLATDSACWRLGIWSHGRLWLAPDAPADPECRLLGAIIPGAAQAAAALRRAREIEQAWRACDDQMDAFFAGLDAAGVREVLHETHETVDHTDPLLLYIGDATLTNFGRFNNLQERNGADLPECLFRRVAALPPQDWRREDRVFVFCFYWLRMAGCRGEEFCGRQLNPALLDVYFDQRLRDYRRIAPPGASIEAKARLLARCRMESANEFLTWRSINGLNFRKDERLMPRAGLAGSLALLPPDLHDFLARRGIDAAAFGSLPELAGACVAQAAAIPADGSGMNGYEKLLKAVVDSAIAATRSDVGMTRGLRDTERLRLAMAERRYGDICAWPSTDYYCGVFPGDALLDRLQHAPESLIKILYACSGRMQFNSWHYMPGHCPRAAVPPDRHFYLPPRMPDIAVWSDQHHAGHVHASVRHSIRSPAPLELDGVSYAGMIDLRLFRRHGPAYTEADLRVALGYTELLRAFCQAAADLPSRAGIALRVAAFTKEWFRDYYTALCATPLAMRPSPPERAENPAFQPPLSHPAQHILHPPEIRIET